MKKTDHSVRFLASSGLSSRAQDTVVSIIENFENNKIPYAIARNYENYPDFGHDLDLFFCESAKSFEEIAISAARKHEWDRVAFCDHWSRSPVREHNIDIFRFYKFEPLEYLQVDLFRGFLAWGCSLASAYEITGSKELHESGCFYHPNLSTENIFRALQINQLLANPKERMKVERYRKRLLSYVSQNRTAYLNQAARMGLPITDEIIDALEAKNFQKFRKLMNKAKRHFVSSKIFRNPVNTVRKMLVRVGDYYRLYHSAPCGLWTLVYAHTDRQKNCVRSALNRMSEAGFIPFWAERTRRGMLNINERKTLERTGVVLEWVNNIGDGKVIVIGEHDEESKIFERLRNHIVFRHAMIFEADRG